MQTGPKDRTPSCVARLLEQAEVERVGWIMAAPPSLDLEIQAIQQVGSASVECSRGHQGRNSSMCSCADPHFWLTVPKGHGYLALGDFSSPCCHVAPPSHLPFSSLLCLNLSCENSLWPCSLTSPTNLWPHHQFPLHLPLALQGLDTTSVSRSRTCQVLASPVLCMECGNGRKRSFPLRTLLGDR